MFLLQAALTFDLIFLFGCIGRHARSLLASPKYSALMEKHSSSWLPRQTADTESQTTNLTVSIMCVHSVHRAHVCVCVCERERERERDPRLQVKFGLRLSPFLFVWSFFAVEDLCKAEAECTRHHLRGLSFFFVTFRWLGLAKDLMNTPLKGPCWIHHESKQNVWFEITI